MPTNTAGSTGYHNADFHGPYLLRGKLLYSDRSGTNNDALTIGVLPAESCVIAAFSHVIVKTAFNDATGNTLDIGISGGNDDWFASALDLSVGSGVLLTLDDLTDTERYSAAARTVTWNFGTAPTTGGTTGEAYVYVGYLVLK